MSYPAYPEMKGSGVEWLGDVPKHWACFMLKRATRFAYGESLSDANREEGAIPVYGSNGVVGTHNEANTKSPCLIIGRKGSYGKVSYSKPSAFAIDTAFFVDKTQTHQNIRWLYYLLSCLNLDGISQDTGVPGLSREDAYSRFIAVPSKTEQQQIAAFLDRKTAELDAVIRLKERQLELLAEKRQALISQAVTRGLDPNVPLKPSGVEWLGDVPEHWEIKRTRYVCHLNPSKSEVSTLPAETMVSFLPMDKVGIEGEIVLDENRAIEDVLQGFTYFRDGDNIVAKITPCFENGKGALVSKLTNNIGFGSTEFHVLRPMQHTVAGFIYYLTRTHLFRLLGTATMYGAGGQKRVPENFIRNFPIAFPPIHEQQAIVAYLDTETGRMEGVGAAIKTQIEKLREYRQALVSAAVTGKIDVRGEP
jgi:type I restriction enzyme S subunit